MKRLETTRTIRAPLDLVFQTISDVRNFSKAVPHIVRIEFLSDQKAGVGTRFRETRLMNGKEQAVELEVAEFVENSRVRMLSDAGGTLWDSVFTVEQHGEDVLMRLVMTAKPHHLPARMMNWLIWGFVSKGVHADMDSVKHYCEENG